MLGYQTIIAAANKISGIPLTASEISNSQKTLNTGPSLSLVNSTNKVIKSTLTIKIEDTEGKSLSDSYTYAGYQGESVTISYNSPNGYVLTNNVSSQVVLNGQQTITAVYAPEKIVSEQVTYQQGTSFTDDDAKNIANTLYTVPTDATVTWSAKPNTENASNTTTNATILVTYASGKQTTITIPYVVSATVTEADKISLNDPEVTKVEDTQALTDDEKSAVATAVKDANPDADISNVSVADDGTATVTFGDGSTSTIAGDKTVVGKTEADKTSLNDPEVTKVEDTQALTDDEKSAVATAVKDANPDADISNVSVADDGTATVTFGDGSTSTIAGDKTVVGKTEADKTSLNDPEVTKVEDTQALTDDEKSAVATAVKDANPDADISDVSVADDGTATVTFGDGSTSTIAGDKTVAGKTEADKTSLNDPEITKVEDTQALTDDEKSAVATAVKDANPDADISDVSVADDGTATVTFGDGSTSTIASDKTVEAKNEEDDSDIVTESSATQVDDDPTVEEPNDDIGENLSNQSMDESTNTDVDTGKMETDTTNLNDPKVTKVENTQALTDDEKSAVVTAVKDANPDADISDVSVADDGTATVTFGDGSTSTINDDKTVVAKLDNDGSNDQSSTGVATRGDLSGNSTSLDEGHSQLSKRASSVKINQKINNDKLPQTGNSKSITGVLIGELLTTFGLIGILRKKKNRSEK